MKSLEQIKQDLTQFLEQNDTSSLDTIAVAKGTVRNVVQNPWGDDSLEFVLPDDDKSFSEICAVLNKLVFFPKFSAIYFPETKIFEVIFTAFQLPEQTAQIIGREFDFNLSGRYHRCKYSRSSSELLEIAKYFQPKRTSISNYRNLASFHRLSVETDETVRERLFGEPISFFISNVPNDEDEIVGIVENLNFFMSYYDLKSPRILIFDDDVSSSVNSSVRYRNSEFPNVIDAPCIDENLLSFWRGAFQGNELLKFMLYFRIIEYASTSYASELVRRRVLQTIKRPEFRSDLEVSASALLEIFNATDSKVVDDFQRFLSTVRENIKVEVLWREIEAQKEFFATDFDCDGGFCIKALVSSDTTIESFRTKGVDAFARQMRDIRNALSHGKDFPRDGVFRPTKRNLDALRPWAILAEIAAGDVVVGKLN